MNVWLGLLFAQSFHLGRFIAVSFWIHSAQQETDRIVASVCISSLPVRDRAPRIFSTGWPRPFGALVCRLCCSGWMEFSAGIRFISRICGLRDGGSRIQGQMVGIVPGHLFMHYECSCQQLVDSATLQLHARCYQVQLFPVSQHYWRIVTVGVYWSRPSQLWWKEEGLLNKVAYLLHWLKGEWLFGLECVLYKLDGFICLCLTI